jgi:hypothetical protein
MFGLVEAVYLVFMVGATIAAVVLRDTSRARFWGAAAMVALLECVLVREVSHGWGGTLLTIPFISIPIVVAFSIARLGRKRSPLLIGCLAGIGNVSVLVVEIALLVGSGLAR